MNRFLRPPKILVSLTTVVILWMLLQSQIQHRENNGVEQELKQDFKQEVKQKVDFPSKQPDHPTNANNQINATIDFKIVNRKANFTHLQRNIHFSDLQSTFNCSKNHLILLILIKSHPLSSNRRESIRKTWGKDAHNEGVQNIFKKFFLIGSSENVTVSNKIMLESQKHSDIIKGSFIDNFYNLPAKAEMGFEWSYKHCSFDYLLETDDDVFLNIPLILSKIRKKEFPSRNAYIGRSKFLDPPVRTALYGEKYIITLHEYAGTVYPPYCSGGAYIFSYDVMAKILPFIKQGYFKLDDVYIGMLAYNAGVNVTHFEGFDLVKEECSLANSTLAHHGAKDIKCMLKLHFQMLIMNIDNDDAQKNYLTDYNFNNKS